MKPILFNTEMVKAILDERKVTTRRAIKRKYDNTHIEWKEDKYGKRLIEIQDDIEETYGRREDGTTWRKLRWCREIEPPYRVGDVLYIRETWRPTAGKMHTIDLSTKKIVKTTEHKGYEYKACTPGKRPYYFPDGFKESEDIEHLSEITYSGKWRPSIHMPKEAARLFLRVTGVRAERLQNMSAADIDREGLIQNTEEHETTPEYFMRWIDLWNSTISPKDAELYGWEANPWVWVVEFERIEGANG